MIVRVESPEDLTHVVPWFAAVADRGVGILDAVWFAGRWVGAWSDGSCLVESPEGLPRAGWDMWIRLEWFPVKLVPSSPGVS